jgi:hypothetical protein
MHHLALIIFEEDFDLNILFLRHLILNRVRTVILVEEGVRNLRIVANLENSDLEVIATGFSVFSELISGLDYKLSGVTD